MNDDINKYLMGGGGSSAKFDTLGDMVKGTIVDCSMQQQTSADGNNTPLTWDNGDPRMQLVIKLQTDERDPEKEDDDGVRAVYAKGGTFEVQEGQGQSMKNAISDAIKKAGAKGITEGDVLTVGYTGVGKKKNRAHNAPKLYTAKYEAGKKTISSSELFDD